MTAKMLTIEEIVKALELRRSTLDFYVKTQFKKVNVLAELDELRRCESAIKSLTEVTS